MAEASIDFPLPENAEKLRVKGRLKAVAVIFLMIMILHLAVWSLVRRYDIFTTPVLSLESDLNASTQIIFMGDSVLNSVSETEPNQQILPELLAAQLPGCTLAAIHRGAASHAGLYQAYINFIAQHQHQPELIIIPINLRSFGAAWSKRPSYQFYNVIRIASESQINPFYRIMESLAQTNYPSEQDYLSEPVYNGQVQIGTVGDFDPYLEIENPSAELKSNVVIMDYMYTLTEDHPRLTQLVALIETARRERIPLLLYVTPIDWQQGQIYHGDAFSAAVNHNLQLILNTLADHEVYPLNMAFDLEHPVFDYQQYMNEHLYFAGRQHIAEQVSRSVIQQLPHCANQPPE